MDGCVTMAFAHYPLFFKTLWNEIKDILELNEIFSHGNMPYIIIATIARLLLEGNEISKKSSYNKFKGWYGPSTEKN